MNSDSNVLVYRFAKAFGWDFVENEVIWDGVMMYISTALERVLGHGWCFSREPFAVHDLFLLSGLMHLLGGYLCFGIVCIVRVRDTMRPRA